MGLLDEANKVADEVQHKRELQKKQEQAKQEGKQEAKKEQARHEYNKRQGML